MPLPLRPDWALLLGVKMERILDEKKSEEEAALNVEEAEFNLC